MSRRKSADGRKRLRYNGEYLSTAYHYRGAIAEILSFPECRYSGPFSRDVLERLYYAIVEQPPTAEMTMCDLRRGIAAELGLSAETLDDPCLYRKTDIVRVFEYIRDLPEEWIETVVSADCCPVCGRVYEGAHSHEDGLSISADSVDVCIAPEETGLVEYLHAE